MRVAGSDDGEGRMWIMLLFYWVVVLDVYA